MTLTHLDPDVQAELSAVVGLMYASCEAWADGEAGLSAELGQKARERLRCETFAAAMRDVRAKRGAT